MKWTRANCYTTKKSQNSVVDPQLHGVNADPGPDPAFYLNANPDPGAKSTRIHADQDPDLGQLKSRKNLHF